jgi:DNA-directed RNA polymerase subunit RPC12/RpoP
MLCKYCGAIINSSDITDDGDYKCPECGAKQ